MNGAWYMLQYARTKSECGSAFCAKAVLFMSDGTPTVWDPDVDYGKVQAYNAGCGGCAKLFTYALGSGADASVLRRLAEENGGEVQVVGDGGNLGNVMARYFENLIGAAKNTDLVRWLRHTDLLPNEVASGAAEKLSACVSIGGGWVLR